MLDPALTTARDFVAKLEEFSFKHRAMDHHLLYNLESASFGPEKTAEMTLLYLTAYSHFTKAFASQVTGLLGKLKDPKHVEVLKENWDEEMGSYDDETKKEINRIAGENIADDIAGVPHKKLYEQMVSHLEEKVGKSFKENNKQLASISAPLLAAKIEIGDSVEALLGTLYFGSELIVPKLYSTFVKALRLSLGYTNKELIFFLLHVDMDADHADEMKEIVVDHCTTRSARLKILQATDKFLNSRIKFYEGVIDNCNIGNVKEEASKLYDKQSGNWTRDEPECLSDFTGRPMVFEMCQKHVNGARVLDVGCGEGYVSRSLLSMGASKVVGIDVSQEMIEKANLQKGPNEHYYKADASDLREVLRQNNVVGNEVIVS